MRVIREGGKLTSNDKTWSYLPHLHVRERGRRMEGKAEQENMNNLKYCCSKSEQGSLLETLLL